jgi:hypothetical protein
MPDLEFNYYSLIGEYFKNIGDLSKAAQAFSKADSVKSKNAPDIVLDKLHLQRQANFHAKQGLYKNAFLELKTYNNISNKILEDNNRKQVSALKYRYQRDTTLIRQQETISSQKAEVKSLAVRQKLIFVIVGLLLLFVVVFILWWHNYEHKKQEIQSLIHARDIALLRMEGARNRVSPHFMFNVLNSIVRNKSSVKEVEKSLKAFINLLQSNLLSIDSIGVALNQELKFVRDYIMLDNLRFVSEIEYIETIDGNVNREMLIPSMSLHILVENAIKHGLRPKKGKKVLEILVTTRSNTTEIRIKNNGTGRQNKKVSSGTGSGLKILKQFIAIVNQNNTEKINFEYIDLFDDKEQSLGTIARLTIPNKMRYEI